MDIEDDTDDTDDIEDNAASVQRWWRGSGRRVPSRPGCPAVRAGPGVLRPPRYRGNRGGDVFHGRGAR
jgi:hypothetical protein